MNKELEVPSYVNDRYKNLKEEEKQMNEQKKKARLKVYKTFFMVIASGGIVLATYNPVKNVVIDFVKTSIEKDNEQFEKETEAMAKEVYRLTGMTPEEIVENGIKNR